MTEPTMIITLWQPWSSLMAVGLKHYETRHWATGFRGKLLIHAAKREMKPEDISVWDHAIAMKDGFKCPHHLHPERTYGRVLAICNLTNCWRMVEQPQESENAIAINAMSDLELMTGLWEPQRYAWECESMKPLTTPLPWRGQQGLAVAPPALLQAVDTALTTAAPLAPSALAG